MIESIASIIQSLRNSQRIIEDYIVAIPGEILAIKRKPGLWSIEEHVFHLAKTQNILFERIKKFRNEANPKIIPYFPDASDTEKAAFVSVEEALDVFKKMRKMQCDEALLLKDTDFRKIGEHGEYKQYDIRILLNHILFHDYWHMYRIEELWLSKDEFVTD